MRKTVSSSDLNIRMGMVAWNALPAIIPRAGRAIGGLETHAWTLAKALAQFTEIRPEFFVRETQRVGPRDQDNVLLNCYREPLFEVRRQVSETIELRPKLRLKSFHASLLWRLPLLAIARPFKHAPPQPMLPDPRLVDFTQDIWAGFGVNADSARVAATAIAAGKPMLLFLESNDDLDPRLAESTDFTSEYGEPSQDRRYVLQHATEVICQSSQQLQQLKQVFGRAGVIIRNPIDAARWKPPTATDRRYVLWVGRYDNFHKRPELVLEIARRCPEITFRMIVNRFDGDVEKRIRCNCPENIHLIDHAPFDQMPSEFAHATAFLSTGNPAQEGFPNVLLQAAASRTPICSLADFDGFIKNSGAGFVCDDSLDTVADQLRKLSRGNELDWPAVERYLDQHYSHRSIAQSVSVIVQEFCECKP